MVSWNLISIGSGNGFMPLQYQAIAWANKDLLSIRPLGTNFNNISNKIWKIYKMHLKMFSARW